ncbi:MAG: CRISPR-associated endonuclease Cas6 [Saprospiraceae bacterium]|nr:CRISPR-associated endonuclease Cas6 [Saprospiraceae bacterium]
MSKPLTLVKVIFDHPIKFADLPIWRRALHEFLLKHGTLPFINHQYEYPYLQLKTTFYHDHLQPMLVILGDQAMNIAELFSAKAGPSFRLQKEDQAISIRYISKNQFALRKTSKPNDYRIFNYQIFNERRYEDFQKMTSPEGKDALIREALQGHIETLYKSVGHQPIADSITQMEIQKSKIATINKTRFLCFDLSFASCAFLPEYIGLGNAVSRGYGVVRPIRERTSRQARNRQLGQRAVRAK